MSAPGSHRDYDNLVSAFTRYIRRETDFDFAPTADNASLADASFLLFKAGAEVCGMAPDEPSPVAWAQRRIESYARLMGVGL